MPAFGPVSRSDRIRHLRQAGFDGPYPGGNHQYTMRGRAKVRIPNPHRGAVSRGLLAIILRGAGISRDAWEQL